MCVYAYTRTFVDIYAHVSQYAYQPGREVMVDEDTFHELLVIDPCIRQEAGVPQIQNEHASNMQFVSRIFEAAETDDPLHDLHDAAEYGDLKFVNNALKSGQSVLIKETGQPTIDV